MSEKNNFPYRKSYESDGVMGKEKKDDKQKKHEKTKDEEMFFNITESSE